MICRNENTEEKIGYRDILHQKEYMKIILAGLVNRFGDSVDAIAFTWLVYAITGNPAWSALVFAANQLPSVLVQPFAGALVERMDKKKLMVAADIVRGIITVGLAALYMGGCLNPWMLLLFTLINSSVEAFRLPAGLAVMPKVLEKKYYAFGTSFHSVLSTVVQMIGLGTAGAIIGFFGIGTAIAIDGVSFFGSAFILGFLKLEDNKAEGRKPNVKEYAETLKDGWWYVGKQPVIRNFCMLTILVNAVLVPLNSLQSPLIVEVLGQGSSLLSAFSVAMAVGMGIGSFIYPFVSERLPVLAQMAGAGILTGIGMYAFTFGEAFRANVPAVYMLAVADSLIIGICCSIMMAALSVQFMKTVRQEYLARAGSIFNAGASAATPAASLAVSALAAFCPVSQIFRLCGILCVIIFSVCCIFRLRLEDTD